MATNAPYTFDVTDSPSLSFENQPSFKALVDAVLDEDNVITLFCGAGISVEAGLPTWNQLIRRLAARIADENLSRLISEHEPDPKRQAQLVLSAINVKLTEIHQIGAALYEGAVSDKDGQLVSEIANLAIKLDGRVRIVTTNYDDRLELAVRTASGIMPSVFGLTELKRWRKHIGLSVLHLHGFIPTKATSAIGTREPLILTEGQYLKHGAAVQEVIRELAATTQLVFVGSSMTDPNLTFPLAEYFDPSRQTNRPHALMVPEERTAARVDEKDAEQLAASLLVALSAMLDSVFNTSVVMLKSYGQVAQCLAEVSTALDNPDSYRSSDPNYSTRYGIRYGRIMREIQQRMGVEDGEYAPGSPKSDTLQMLLWKEYSAGPSSELKRLLNRRKAALEKKGYRRDYFSDEKWGLHLWLRTVRPEPEFSPYEVFVVGSSAYARRDGRTMMQRSGISSLSIYASAQSVYLGQSVTFSLGSDGSSRPGGALDRPWRSYYAVPLAVSEFDLGMPAGSAAKVTVGSIVLHSSHVFYTPEQLDNMATLPDDVSFASVIPKDVMEKVFDSVRAAGLRVLQASL